MGELRRLKPREEENRKTLLMCIRGLARTQVRYGYYRIDILLRREGRVVNHKRVYRLYREDALFDGRRLRALTIVDAYMREALTIEVDQGIKGEPPDRRVYENGVTLDFSRPGKPTDNAFVESFNGRFRDECLNARWFLSLADARGKIEAEFASSAGVDPGR